MVPFAAIASVPCAGLVAGVTLISYGPVEPETVNSCTLLVFRLVLIEVGLIEDALLQAPHAVVPVKQPRRMNEMASD
jgi:hypothetical protein